MVHTVGKSVGNERGDIEIKDSVILPRGEDNLLPPHTLITDVTITHDRYGRTTHFPHFERKKIQGTSERVIVVTVEYEVFRSLRFNLVSYYTDTHIYVFRSTLVLLIIINNTLLSTSSSNLRSKTSSSRSQSYVRILILMVIL